MSSSHHTSKFISLFIIFFLTGYISLRAEIIELPELKNRITDLTSTLTSDEIIKLEEKLSIFEKEKGSQVAILILDTTGDESIEQFSIRLAEKWKLGRKNIDDGVILIVSKNDRKLRIEVGYGLEASLTDVISWRIIDDIIVPHFKKGEFFEGIDAGTDAILTVISGEELPLPEANFTTENDEDSSNAAMVLLVIVIFIGLIIRGIFGIAAAFFGTGILAFLASLLFFPIMLSAVIAIIAAVMAAIMGSGRGGGGGGFSSYSGGGFSGGFGGGGFSGGGGSFGGGGASGSW